MKMRESTQINRDIWQHLETFLVVTTWWVCVYGAGGLEARDAAKHPAVPSTAPSTKKCLAHVSVVPRWRNPDTQGLGVEVVVRRKVWGKDCSTCAQHTFAGCRRAGHRQLLPGMPGKTPATRQLSRPVID